MELPGQPLRSRPKTTWSSCAERSRICSFARARCPDRLHRRQGRQPAQRQCARKRSADPAQGALCQRRPQQGKAARHQCLQHRLRQHAGTCIPDSFLLRRSLTRRRTGSNATVGNELNLFAFLPGLNLGATIQALETEGVVEVLAEPNMVAVNGKEASFLAGGEYPYPGRAGRRRRRSPQSPSCSRSTEFG